MSISPIIFDSSKVTLSLVKNLFEFKNTTFTLFVDLVTTLAMHPLSDPMIFSPIIAFPPIFKTLLKDKVSKVGFEVFKDSYTAKTFATSG